MARNKSTTAEKPQEPTAEQGIEAPATDAPAPSTAVVKVGRTKKGDVLVMMTPEEAKATSTQIKRDLTHAGQLLLEMRDREGWKALGYSGFVEWAKAEVGKSSATVYRYLNTAEEERTDQRRQARLAAGEPDTAPEPGSDKPRRGRPKGSGRSNLSPEERAAFDAQTAALTSSVAAHGVPKPTSNGKRQGQLLDAAYAWKPAVRMLEAAEVALDTKERAVMSLTHEEREEYAERLQRVAEMLVTRAEKIRSIEASGTTWDDDMAAAPIEYEVTPPAEESADAPMEEPAEIVE